MKDTMEKELKALLDYQRIAQNARLAALIGAAEERYGHTLSDEELSLVSAAGDLDAQREKKGEDHGGKE